MSLTSNQPFRYLLLKARREILMHEQIVCIWQNNLNRTIGINISMRAKIHINFWNYEIRKRLNHPTDGLNFKLFDKQNGRLSH